MKSNLKIIPHNYAMAEEQKQMVRQDPDQPDMPRSLKVAVIGAPNAGKSTLVNKLLGWKVFDTQY